MQAAERLKDDKSIVFCFVGGGSEFKRVRRWAEAGKRSNVLCLPYQPLAELSVSLSAADAHAIVMGDAMLGLVHPCKIYNVLAVGAPVIYIEPGPATSRKSSISSVMNIRASMSRTEKRTCWQIKFKTGGKKRQEADGRCQPK